MTKPASFSSAAMFSVALLLLPIAAFAQIGDDMDLAWASYRDLTSAQFSQRFNELSGQSMRMVDVDAYQVGNAMRYSMVWRANSDNRGWAELRDMTAAAFDQQNTSQRGQNRRLIDFEAYNTPNGMRYAGIWIQNRENLTWNLQRDMTAAALGAYHASQGNAGFRPLDVDAYMTPAGLRYSLLTVRNPGNEQWILRYDLTPGQYQQEVDTRSAQGFMVADVEVYNNGQRYAAIWGRRPGNRAVQVRTGRTELEYSNLYRQYADEGYRLIDFERSGTQQAPRYGGVWIENSSRYRYNRKTQINTAITNYRRNNNVPGISVAVMLNDQLVYRRGFGFADSAANKVAHAGTVYSIASVSKTYGGTLAALLAQNGRLRSGRQVSVNLGARTSSIIPNTPRHHTHTLRQLLGHLGCVAHYPANTTPGIPNQSQQFGSQQNAVRAIWDTALVTTPACRVDTTYSYSTPAFTFVGAALETSTNRTITQLLNEELLTPLGLTSTRVQYATATLPANYERAAWYRDNGLVGGNYPNNSWKVLGGGLESDVMDVARWGWRVRRGDVVTANTRDTQLWAPVRPDCGNSTVQACTTGLGWFMGTENGRRYAEHGGSVEGARSHLRVYRDNNLVIAVLTNRRRRNNNTTHNPATLVDQIAGIVLTAPTLPVLTAPAVGPIRRIPPER